MIIPGGLKEVLSRKFPDGKMAGIAEGLITLATDRNVRAELQNPDQHVRSLLAMMDKDDLSALETALAGLYTCVHNAGSRYSPSEKRLLKSRGGYSSFPGGFSPLIKAEPFIASDTVIADLGAGNGLQGLLFQHLYPHQRTLQVEISAEMIRVGRMLQNALGIGEDRVTWVHDDIANLSLDDVDFIYIYRPARSLGGGRQVYRDIADKLIASNKSPVVFSIADCLAGYLAGHFTVFDSDGHLTCFQRPAGGIML